MKSDAFPGIILRGVGDYIKGGKGKTASFSIIDDIFMPEVNDYGGIERREGIYS